MAEYAPTHKDPAAPPLAIRLHDLLIAAGFPYSAPWTDEADWTNGGWATGFVVSWKAPPAVLVWHWDDTQPLWRVATLDERTAYRERLYTYWRALANANAGLEINEGQIGNGRPALVVREQEVGIA